MSKRRARYGPDWRWRTFPVFAACVFGALVASFLDRPNSDFAVGVRVMLVLAAAYCVAHIVIMYVVMPRRHVADKGAPNEHDDEDYEEELVFESEKVP